MLVLYPDRVHVQSFGLPLPAVGVVSSLQPIVIIAFSDEVDRSRMDALPFFERIYDYWSATSGATPDNFILWELPCLNATALSTESLQTLLQELMKPSR